MGLPRLAGLIRRRTLITWLVYGAAEIVLLLLQTAPRAFPAVFGARPLPLLVLVACIATFEGGKGGAVAGFFAGLLWDILSLRLFGFDALVLMLTGLCCGLLVEWLLRANFSTAMLLCAGTVLLWTMLDWLFFFVLADTERPLSVLLRVLLTDALYTMLLAPLLFWPVLWLAHFVRRHGREQ